MPTLGQDIRHSAPHRVPVKKIIEELNTLRGEGMTTHGTPSAILRACTMTLVVLCDRGEEPDELEQLVAQVVTSNPARVILIAQNDPDSEGALEARVSIYESGSNGATRRLVGEEIAFYPHGKQYESLPSAVLGLRVSALPFVMYRRGHPDLTDPVFHALAGECDQMLFDSQHFTARAEQVNNTIARLRLEYPHVSFGDVNWQRIRPWRQLVAQFFDDPSNLVYLDAITHIELDFSVGFGGNQSAALLLTAWLGSSLGWQFIPGSYQREGLVRTLRFERGAVREGAPREILVEIRVREQPDCMPGELTGIRVEAVGDPPGVFEIRRAVGGFVDIKDWTGDKLMERCATLNIPEESEVITSELDAVRSDRNYHRALDMLEALARQPA